MFLKPLLLIEFWFKLLIFVFYNIISTRMDKNNDLYHQNTMIVKFIIAKLDENTMAVTTFTIELTIGQIVIFELLKHLIYLWFYSLTLERYPSQKLSHLHALNVKNLIFWISNANINIYILRCYQVTQCSNL